MNLFSRKTTAADLSASLPAAHADALAQDNERDAINVLEALRQGRFDVDIRVSGSLGQALERLASHMQDQASSDLKRTVQFSSQASNSMVAVANIVEDIKKVGNDAETMASAAEEMSASVNQVASASASTSNAAQMAQDSAMSGIAQIDNTTTAMQDISHHVSTLSTRLGVLEDAAQKIEGMAQSIEDISDQTKLLALNATIEAARAGEAGKGFAVVANEVKSLSEQTSKATDSIRDSINTLNTDMREMKNAMTSSGEAVTRGEEMVGAIGELIGEIVEQISSANAQIGEIAGVLEQQRYATDEISENITMVASRAARSRDGANEVTRTVGNTERLINDQFAALESMVLPNYVLHRAKSDHMIWNKKMAEMLAGLESLNPSELADHHSCRLGKWYDAVTDASLVNNPVFRDLQAPHEEIHRYGKQAARLYAEGRIEEARAEYQKMEAASLKVIAGLDQLISANER